MVWSPPVFFLKEGTLSNLKTFPRFGYVEQQWNEIWNHRQNATAKEAPCSLNSLGPWRELGNELTTCHHVVIIINHQLESVSVLSVAFKWLFLICASLPSISLIWAAIHLQQASIFQVFRRSLNPCCSSTTRNYHQFHHILPHPWSKKTI